MYFLPGVFEEKYLFQISDFSFEFSLDTCHGFFVSPIIPMSGDVPEFRSGRISKKFRFRPESSLVPAGTKFSEKQHCFQIVLNCFIKWVQLQFVEHSNRRKMQSYSMRRKNSISAIIFIWLYFVAINIFVVWLGRFAPFAK